MKLVKLVILAVLGSWFGHVAADSAEARCDIYPAGEDHASDMLACTFSQRQGAVTISRADGVVHDLVPVGDTPGNYKDQDGNPAYRQSGLGDQGLIFRLKDESVYVYWSTAALQPEPDEENWTAPYSTADYDATTRIPCGPKGAPDDTCPAGILRMEDGQASVDVIGVEGDEFTFNFMTDYINAANREVEARLEGDTWYVTVDNKHSYLVPLAAIEGG